MRTEKSKLLQISLCVLSCVFFGCGNKNNNSTPVTDNDINVKEPYVGTVGSNKNEVCNPLVNVLQKVFEKKNVQDLVNKAKGYIKDDGSLIEGKNIEEFNDILDKLTKAIEDETNNVLEELSIDDLLKDVENSENISDIQDPNLKNVLKNLNSINNVIESLIKDPLKYLYKSGKKKLLFFHRSTLKALDCAWNSSVRIIKKSFDKSLKKWNEMKENPELDEKSKKTFDEMFERVSSFYKEDSEIRTKILNTLYKDLGDKLLKDNGGFLFDFINVHEKENKISSDWSDFVFCYYYLGTKTSRREFANLACVCNGESAKKFKNKNVFDEKLKDLQDEYCKICDKFVEECLKIDAFKSIKSKKDDIIECLKDYDVNNKLALSPWMMICAEDKFSDIVSFLGIKKNNGQNNVYTLDENATYKKLKDDKDKSVEFKAGVLAVLNFCIGLSKANDNNKIEIDKTIKDFENDLRTEVLKERKQQWEKIKNDIAADKESTEDFGGTE